MEATEEKNQRKRQSKINYKGMAVDAGRFIAVTLAQGALAAAGARLVNMAVQRRPQSAEVVSFNRKAL